MGARGPSLHGQLCLYPHQGPRASMGSGPACTRLMSGWGHKDQAGRPLGKEPYLSLCFFTSLSASP